MRTIFNKMTDLQKANLMTRLEGIHSSMKNITPQFAIELNDTIPKLFSAILHHKDPLEVFNFISNGSYKACFDLCSGWVVKFTQWNSDLEDERATYEAALNTGLGDLFAPTFYIYMPGIGMPCSIMIEQGKWCDEHWDEEKREYVDGGDNTLYFDAVIIQRKVDYLLCNIDSELEAKYTCDKDKVYDNELGFAPDKTSKKQTRWFVVDPGTAKTDEELIEWEYNHPGYVDMDYIIEDQHGPEFFKNYIDFYRYWSMADLHIYNVGFMRVDDNPYHDKLIIIDWLSYSPETSCTQTES